MNSGPRPGGQCPNWWVTTTGATGIATPLNSGLWLFYNDVGNLDSIVMEGGPLPFSLEPIRLSFKRDFPDIENWVIDLSLGIWLDDFAIPIEWAETIFRPPQPARLPIIFPPMGDFSAALISGSVPNDIKLTPVNDNGVAQWSNQP